MDNEKFEGKKDSRAILDQLKEMGKSAISSKFNSLAKLKIKPFYFITRRVSFELSERTTSPES